MMTSKMGKNPSFDTKPPSPSEKNTVAKSLYSLDVNASNDVIHHFSEKRVQPRKYKKVRKVMYITYIYIIY